MGPKIWFLRQQYNPNEGPGEVVVNWFVAGLYTVKIKFKFCDHDIEAGLACSIMTLSKHQHPKG